jgi:hypothetical protein
MDNPTTRPLDPRGYSQERLDAIRLGGPAYKVAGFLDLDTTAFVSGGKLYRLELAADGPAGTLVVVAVPLPEEGLPPPGARDGLSTAPPRYQP